MGEELYLALWDPDRTDSQLLEACARSLRAGGGRLQRHEDGGRLTGVAVREHPLCPRGKTLLLEPARQDGGDGGLVQTVLPADWYDEHGWDRWRRATARLLADTRPLLMICPVELPVDELPDPPPDLAADLFRVGWVDPARLSEVQRESFERALRGGPRSDVAGGWWWSADPDRDPAGKGVPEGEAEAFGGRLATAFTGKPATGMAATVTELPASHRELWLWAADRDGEQLHDQVRTWAEALGYDEEQVGFGPNGRPGWFPVVLSLGPDADPAELLAPLRQAVAEVHPAWAALQPESGIAAPGLDPEAPATGVLHNVWVSNDWVGGRRGRLLDALDGAYREELAGGTLLLTTPEVLPGGDFAAWCHDPAARWQRLVDAAAVLAEAARASRPGD